MNDLANRRSVSGSGRRRREPSGRDAHRAVCAACVTWARVRATCQTRFRCVGKPARAPDTRAHPGSVEARRVSSRMAGDTHAVGDGRRVGPGGIRAARSEHGIVAAGDEVSVFRIRTPSTSAASSNCSSFPPGPSRVTRCQRTAPAAIVPACLRVSITPAADTRLRWSRSCRASVARFSSRCVRTRSATQPSGTRSTHR